MCISHFPILLFPIQTNILKAHLSVCLSPLLLLLLMEPPELPLLFRSLRSSLFVFATSVWLFSTSNLALQQQQRNHNQKELETALASIFEYFQLLYNLILIVQPRVSTTTTIACSPFCSAIHLGMVKFASLSAITQQARFQLHFRLHPTTAFLAS